MEQIEKKFITSYLSILAKEGKEICKEVDSIMCDNDELMVEKATTYCNFISHSIRHGFDPKLVDRCRKYIDDVNNFMRFKSTFNKVNIDRREKERWLDMRNMRLNGI